MPILLQIACLCGAVDQSLAARLPDGHDPTKPIPLTICHCTTCRQTSGVLCTSYCPIEPPEKEIEGNDLLTVYTASSSPSPRKTRRYFCKTCGCHIFRCREPTTSTASGDEAWEVATGVISDERRLRDGDDGNNTEENNDDDTPVLAFVRHEHVDDTGDGGLAVWLPSVGEKPMEGHQPAPAVDDTDDSTPDSRTVSAACHCGAVQFDICPPDHDPAASRQPHSGFSDLLVPYATTDPAITSNPDDVKWWLRPSSRQDGTKTKTTRWLAGTCACRSCRLSTGFEIQAWTFVPRGCIFVGGKTLTFGNAGNADEEKSNTPPALSAYQSSPGVERNFCGCCGARVFWHDIWRPDLIDISVGLLRSTPPNGSRVESLLDWCTTRVSFVEEAPRGRHGQSARRGTTLTESLEAHMKRS